VAWIGGTGLVLGLLLALGALYRERDAQARSLQLQFELQRQLLERQALDAKLALLRSQIEPHFLFNTLTNVQALVESGSPRAGAVLGSLIAYLRAAMPRLHEQQTTLGDELALVRAYLELMHMRMPDRLQYDVQVDVSLSWLRFPPMALLTLVENAVRHGIDPCEGGGRIELGAARSDGETRIWVEDGGVGMADDAAPGTGLNNLRERLQSFYDPPAQLRLSVRAPHGVRAEIAVPDAARSS
jgi:sensor histidine kinase YesM